MFLTACPSFHPSWDAMRRGYEPGSEPDASAFLGALRFHVVGLASVGRAAEFTRFAQMLDRLLAEADPILEDLLTEHLVAPLAIAVRTARSPPSSSSRTLVRAPGRPGADTSGSDVALPPARGLSPTLAARRLNLARRAPCCERMTAAPPNDLESLLTARALLVREAAPLHARYGIGGTFIELREVLRAELAVDYRTRLADYEGRVTQAMVDEAVRADPRYVALLTEAEAGRARLYVLYDDIRAATARFARCSRPATRPRRPSFRLHRMDDLEGESITGIVGVLVLLVIAVAALGATRAGGAPAGAQTLAVL